MMFDRHVSDRLAVYVDESRDADSIERHLSNCDRCRGELAMVRAGMGAVESLRVVEAPDSIWTAIESALDAPTGKRSYWKPAFAVAAIVIATVAVWMVTRPRVRWEVAGLSGSPMVDARRIGARGRVGAGEWVETDAQSSARIKVGEIGTVVLAPNTRARVVATRADDHRIALAHGEIHAQITAPPRLFFVDTAAGTAVDLGCEYALFSEEDGTGLMRVTRGWVSFEWNGRESLVPAGASCRTRPRLGPGTPWFDDASEGFRRALDDFDQTSSDGALSTVLAASRVRDTLTLWHLVSRVSTADRGRVYDRIAALAPVPGVTKDLVSELDPATLKHWKDELAWTW
jgi:FecR protein